MAATVELRSLHGATGATFADVAGGSVRFKQADNDTVDANNPIPVPGSGHNYSYIKQLRLYAATAPSNLINNLKFYTDGANGFGTGVSLYAKTSASYTDPTSQTTTALGGTADAFTYTSGSALAVSGSSSAVGYVGDYVQLQMGVQSTAAQGTTPSETLTMSYDES